MKRETFEALKTGVDTRPWLFFGGPHDGTIKHISDAHNCGQYMMPYVCKDGQIAHAVYKLDHDGHVLEFEPTPEWNRNPPSIDD